MRYIPNYHGLGERIAREFKRIAYAVNGEPEWISPTLENSWAEVSGYPVRFRKLGNGMVIIEGRVDSGTLTNRAYQLPEGYRPGQVHTYSMDSGSGHGQFKVTASGDVTPNLAPGSGNLSNLYTTFFAER